jgi:flavin-dependent dehydrogenase
MKEINQEPVQTIQYQRANLPILAEGDLLVVGGSFGGIACALGAARAGLRVILVETRTFLGREVTATLRPWFTLAEREGTVPLPDLISEIILATGSSSPKGGIFPLKLGMLKTFLEDQCLAVGIHIIYSSIPVELVYQAEALAGVVIGNKSGRQAITAPVVVDATETNLLARLAGMKTLSGRGSQTLYHCMLEFDRLKEIPADRLQVPGELDIAGNEIRYFPGADGEEHGFIECPLFLERNIQDIAGWTAREIQARHTAMKLTAYLLKNVPAFQRAYLARISFQLDGPASNPIEPMPVTWVDGLENTTLDPGEDPFSISVRDLAGRLPGLFILGDGMLSDEQIRACLNDPVGAARVGQALGAWIVNNFQSLTGKTVVQVPDGQYSPPKIDNRSPSNSEIQINELSQPQRGHKYRFTPVCQTVIRVMRNTEVLVVGGGSSGATAAIVCAREGVRTMMVEFNPGLGGTGTFGGVHSYWFPRRMGFTAEVIEAVEAEHAALGMNPPEGSLMKWNIEAKSHALLQRAEQAGVEMLWNSTVTGTLVEGTRVCGVIVATLFGPAAILAEVVVDATGDGDVATFAGAEHVYGASRDHITMWYALAQFYRPGMTNNNFTSMVDVGNVEDYTRAILAGRRRAEKYDAGTYIAPRESRHILADVVLTLNDQLLKRCWPDTVYIAFSNHDIKGHTSSDWIRAGLLPPNLKIEIPYRALMPRKLEGILITGKAISATHDAQAAVRMQPDMENLGGVTGLAAALAVKTGCLPSEVNVGELQNRLVAAHILPESILTRTLQPRKKDPQTLASLLQQMDPQNSLIKYQDMELDVEYQGNIPIVELCCRGPEAVHTLEKAYENSSGDARLMLARALALVGSKSGVPDLIEAIHAETPDEGLQYRNSHIRHVNLPPDQGAAPDVVYLLYSLGMTRDARALPVWEHFADLITAAGAKDIRDRFLNLFSYVDSICYGAERLGDRHAIPLLKRMHRNPIFQNRVVRESFETDYFLERQAYLEMVIARALACCGDETGYETLTDYLEDDRALLAEHAHSELVRLTGQDFGKDRQAWRSWLAQTKHQRKPLPLEEPMEPVTAWNEEILTCSNDPEDRQE